MDKERYDLRKTISNPQASIYPSSKVVAGYRGEESLHIQTYS